MTPTTIEPRLPPHHKTRERSEQKERDRGTEGETSYLDELIREEEQTRKWKSEKKRKVIEAQRVKPPTVMRS